MNRFPAFLSRGAFFAALLLCAVPRLASSAAARPALKKIVRPPPAFRYAFPYDPADHPGLA